MGGKNNTWWLCTEFSASFSDEGSRFGAVLNPALKRQADSSFAHAEYRIANHASEFDCIDAILALKRAMQTRLDHLDEIYKFNQYSEAKNLGWLGLLESWGVIRQRMLRRMRQLRNAVEHDGAEPPSLEECQDYCEVAWWFLRGTSPLLMPLTETTFIFDEGHVSFRFRYSPVTILASGRVNPEMLSDAEIAGWTKIEMVPERRTGEPNRETPYGNPEDGTYQISFRVADPSSVHSLLRMAFKELL
ncbi:hypothetical protein [Streptomyces sp. NPDC002564]|uniref:hypothetical protein n=1 Tax=Streptomyces sp. NPDC002564 TaxID=3364649 RepID=UPI003688B28A